MQLQGGLRGSLGWAAPALGITERSTYIDADPQVSRMLGRAQGTTKMWLFPKFPRKEEQGRFTLAHVNCI